jgi:ACT domain-containing protein
MADEELIYRITRTVYEQLGAGADEQTVERLVTEIYSAIRPSLATAAPTRVDRQEDVHDTSRSPESSSRRLVISVFGVDHPGIVAAVSQVLAEADCSIIDINQTVVRSKFAMVIIADISRARMSVTALKERFREAGERIGVKIYAQREDLFNAMHRV